jgi:NAD(P)-dependent dehydrogenase (short-subunit alcohol dehydrogenase family)
MTKFAVEGLSETLVKEIGPLGVGVMVVEPGAFRTDFRGASMKQSGIRLGDYAGTAGKARDSVLAGHGQQQGDPARGSHAIITALESDRSPLHLVIGSDALDLVRAKLDDLKRDSDTWEHLTRSTDYVA